MAGIKRLLGVIIPFFGIFLMSQNVSALSPSYTDPNYIWRTPNNATNWKLQNQGHVNLKNYLFSNIGTQYIGRYQFSFPTQIGSLADNTVLYLEFQLKTLGSDYGTVMFGKSRDARINNGGQTSGYCTVKSSNSNSVTWFCEYTWNNPNVNLSSIWLDVGNLMVEDNGNPWGNVNGDYLLEQNTFWVEYINYSYQTGLNASSQAIINAVNNSNAQLINQNQTIINQNQTNIDQNTQMIQGQNSLWQQNHDYYEEQNEASDNISNQSSGDIQGSDNQQTTSLINVISGFISAFSGITAGNCNLTLEFPNYAGGTRVVNICSGKDKAPRIVEIGSSMLLICVFVPLAYIVIRMIYNEIRSWTNG